MNVIDAIATRHSCRNYTAEPVSRQDLEALALAAVQAPSARGNAPWKFVVITDPTIIQDLSDSAVRVIARHEASAAKWFNGTTLFYGAPAVILAATRNTWDYTSEQLDIGLAVENITLAATGLGLGSVICGFVTQAFRDNKSTDPERLYGLLGLPREYEIAVGIAVGHPAEPGTPHTPDLSAVSYF